MFYSGIADEAGKPLEMQIRAHKELGWSHIEIRNVNETTLSYATDAEFKQISARLNDAGMKVSCFASQIANWARDIAQPFDKDEDELRRAIPRMRELGTPFIRIMSYANKTGISATQWRDETVKRIATLAKMAEDGGVTLVHENCDGWGGLGPEQSIELLRAVGSPALKLVFDTGNTIAHGQNAWDYYSKVKPHIAYVHIKDMRQEGDQVRATFPGEGSADVERILRDLLTWYDGGMSIEPHVAAVVHTGQTADPETLFKTYVEYGQRFMKMVGEIRGE